MKKKEEESNKINASLFLRFKNIFLKIKLN
jgi:hypothetical protein